MLRVSPGWIPLTAAIGCIAAGFGGAVAEAQAAKLTRPVPEWGVNAAIESDLLRSGNSRRSALREKASTKLSPTANTDDPRKLRVLLVGNSYTRFNLLHMLIERLAEASGGPRVQVEVEARSGYSLRLHWKQRAALNKIKNGRFTHVVLQGHSLSAVDHPDELAEDAERFSAAIAAAGARTVLFETWARKPGTSLYRKHESLRTFEEMVSMIDTAYSGAARRLHVGLAPVGGAFERAFRSNPSVPLWGSDGSHPTLAGSYMAACVLFGAITGIDPRHATWEPHGVPAQLAENIRAVASATLSHAPSLPARHPHVDRVDRQAVAAISGEAANQAAKPAVRSSAKPVEVGQVAASIAAMMGRAPGQAEPPNTAPSAVEPEPQEAVPAAGNAETTDHDVPVLLLRDMGVDPEPEKASFVDSAGSHGETSSRGPLLTF